MTTLRGRLTMWYAGALVLRATVVVESDAGHGSGGRRETGVRRAIRAGDVGILFRTWVTQSINIDGGMFMS